MGDVSDAILLADSMFCLKVVCSLFAAAGGVFGAVRARKIGAPGRGPLVLAGAVAFTAITLVGNLLLLLVSETLRSVEVNEAVRVMTLLLSLMKVVGFGGIIAGLWLVQPMPEQPAEPES